MSEHSLTQIEIIVWFLSQNLIEQAGGAGLGTAGRTGWWRLEADRLRGFRLNHGADCKRSHRSDSCLPVSFLVTSPLLTGSVSTCGLQCLWPFYRSHILDIWHISDICITIHNSGKLNSYEIAMKILWLGSPHMRPLKGHNSRKVENHWSR